jgi:hypothetical protein
LLLLILLLGVYVYYTLRICTVLIIEKFVAVTEIDVLISDQACFETLRHQSTARADEETQNICE